MEKINTTEKPVQEKIVEKHIVIRDSSSSHFLMMILILVTMAVAIFNHKQQQEMLEIQKQIYKPIMIPIETSAPFKISDESTLNVGVGNNGYMPGSYSLTVFSDHFKFDFGDEISNERQVVFSYTLQHGEDDSFKVKINPPNSKVKPLVASFYVKHSSGHQLDRLTQFCYHLDKDAYTKVECEK